MVGSAISDWERVTRGTIEGSSSVVQRGRGDERWISALELYSPG